MLVAALVIAAAGAQVPAAIALAPSAPRTARLSAAQMFALADFAQANGDVQAAAKIYQALARDPDHEVSAEARFRRAKQLIVAKQTAGAAVLLRSIVDDKPDATGVRLELASLLHQLGEDELALRQLRAAQAAGLPPSVARIVQRFTDALRSQRPFGASFEIAVAPDSNISRATRSDTLGTVFGDFDIDEDSKARSGLGLALSGQVYRRFGFGTSDHDLLVRASGVGNLYRRGRFNDVAVDLAAGPELRVGRGQLNLEAGATQRWYGQKAFSRSARLGASWALPIGTRTQLRLSGTGSRIKNQANGLQSGNSYSAQIRVEHALSPILGVGLSLSADRLSAKDPGYSTKSWTASVLAWRDLGRATITAEAQYGRLRADERLALFSEARSDRFSRVTIGASIRRLTLGGFAPVARLVIERNQSSIAFFDYKRTRTEFGITRAF